MNVFEASLSCPTKTLKSDRSEQPLNSSKPTQTIKLSFWWVICSCLKQETHKSRTGSTLMGFFVFYTWTESWELWFTSKFSNIHVVYTVSTFKCQVSLIQHQNVKSKSSLFEINGRLWYPFGFLWHSFSLHQNCMAFTVHFWKGLSATCDICTRSGSCTGKNRCEADRKLKVERVRMGS